MRASVEHDRRTFLEALLSLGATVAPPAYATDVHHHIYDSRFPADPSAALRPADATVDDYRRLQKRIGIGRHVIVQPSTYGTDNSCLLDALSRFGDTARGIAVVNTQVSSTELKRLDAAGVRGLRFNLLQAGATTPDMIEPLSKRIESLGWHIQVNASPEQILASTDIWNRLPVQIVFDHFGHVSDIQSPGFRLLCKLMQKGRAWTKLSSAETASKVGPPSYSDIGEVAGSYITAAPERLLWGTNWPHPLSRVKPDDLVLFNLLGKWAPNETVRSKMLVKNPEELFGFH